MILLHVVPTWSHHLRIYFINIVDYSIRRFIFRLGRFRVSKFIYIYLTNKNQWVSYHTFIWRYIISLVQNLKLDLDLSKHIGFDSLEPVDPPLSLSARGRWWSSIATHSLSLLLPLRLEVTTNSSGSNEA